MCVEIHHHLAYSHYNEGFDQPFEILECPYMTLRSSEKAMWERTQGRHTVKQGDRESFDYDY
jgi:hypothetical protein